MSLARTISRTTTTAWWHWMPLLIVPTAAWWATADLPAWVAMFAVALAIVAGLKGWGPPER